MSRGRALLPLRLASGGVFVAFGAGKFVNHGSELASFKAYGLPAPEAFVNVSGVIEPHVTPSLRQPLGGSGLPCRRE